VPPVADDGENEQQDCHEKQSGGFGGVDGMVVVMTLMVSDRLRRNGGVHADIVTFFRRQASVVSKQFIANADD
jgi:hypothetical protein